MIVMLNATRMTRSGLSRAIFCSLGILAAAMFISAMPSWAVYAAETGVVKSDDGKALRKIQENLDEIYRAREAVNWDIAPGEKSARERKLADIKRTALEALGQSEAADLLKQIDISSSKIAAKRSEIAKLASERAIAPDEAGGEGIVSNLLNTLTVRTKKDFDDDIRDAEGDIASLEEGVVASKREFVASLSAIGVEIEQAEVESLLKTVTAPDMIQLQVVYEMLFRVHKTLADAIEASSESIDVARRYYGYHAALLEMAVFMHDSFIIEGERHRMNLSNIVMTARALRDETDALLKAGESGGRTSLEANRRSQDLTIEAGSLYSDHIRTQIIQVRQAQDRIQRELDIAVNTVRTVSLAGDLVQLIRTQTGSFESLRDLEVPKLRPFENRALEDEWDDLTTKLRGSTPGS